MGRSCHYYGVQGPGFRVHGYGSRVLRYMKMSVSIVGQQNDTRQKN